MNGVKKSLYFNGKSVFGSRILLFFPLKVTARWASWNNLLPDCSILDFQTPIPGFLSSLMVRTHAVSLAVPESESPMIKNKILILINHCNKIGDFREVLPTYLVTYLPSYLPTYLPTYLLTYLPTYLLTYLPTYLPTTFNSSCIMELFGLDQN